MLHHPDKTETQLEMTWHTRNCKYQSHGDHIHQITSTYMSLACLWSTVGPSVAIMMRKFQYFIMSGQKLLHGLKRTLPMRKRHLSDNLSNLLHSFASSRPIVFRASPMGDTFIITFPAVRSSFCGIWVAQKGDAISTHAIRIQGHKKK